MTNLVTKVRFVHDQSPFVGRRTVAMAVGSDGKIHVGVAWCNNKDQFSRRLGRTVAEGRLKGNAQKHYHSVLTFDELKSLIGDSVESSKNVSTKLTPLEFCFSLVAKDKDNLK